jgi:tetrahydromethanopterin S-methyltransferase subunit D
MRRRQTRIQDGLLILVRLGQTLKVWVEIWLVSAEQHRARRSSASKRAVSGSGFAPSAGLAASAGLTGLVTADARALENTHGSERKN